MFDFLSVVGGARLACCNTQLAAHAVVVLVRARPDSLRSVAGALGKGRSKRYIPFIVVPSPFSTHEARNVTRINFCPRVSFAVLTLSAACRSRLPAGPRGSGEWRDLVLHCRK